MITKILFTLLVIIGTILFFKGKRGQQVQQVATKRVERSENEKMFRAGAYLFMLFMVISALAVFVFKLGDDYATVKVHVINTQNGQRVTYQAENKDIKSTHFVTIEGRTVYVADIERIEIEPGN